MNNVYGFIYGKNDASNLQHALPSLLKQDLDYYLYVDDGSSDQSITIAQEFGFDVIKARNNGHSWLGTPKLSLTVNKGIEAMRGSNFFVISGSDIILPGDYVKTLIHLMEENPKIVFASGMIEGESYNIHLPKGAGRVHRASYWWRYISKHRFCWIWESFPVYKAQSQGFKTVLVPSLKMRTLRKSAWRKKNQVYAMKQLGVFPIYALFRAFRQSGLDGIVSYLCCHDPVIDEEVANWEKLRNIHRILRLWKR